MVVIGILTAFFLGLASVLPQKLLFIEDLGVLRGVLYFFSASLAIDALLGGLFYVESFNSNEKRFILLLFNKVYDYSVRLAVKS
ncbi:hypothetical protein A3K63_04940 [Candidatus Micrarchaeota archaeon RBG_16_49_10]|nr:MAG: hypothetical protein A3K63_04940 [Candidatus Micrarchaeota archaeon RBG_16_49_10]